MCNCMFCGTPLKTAFVDLKNQPLSNSYVPFEQALEPETFYPLTAYVCDHCRLVQVPPQETPENIFTEYQYFSSYSTDWLVHCRRYVEDVISRFGLSQNSNVVELASNDGYLLQFFVEKGFHPLGVEPAKNVAKVAAEKGIETRTEFFGTGFAQRLKDERGLGDLIIANNVLAHVPDINDFVEGIKILLEPSGVATFEVPHLCELVKNSWFDTIYHEHFSYFSLFTVKKIFEAHSLRVFDVERLKTHGGSLRLFVCHNDQASQPTSECVTKLLAEEERLGIDSDAYYSSFKKNVERIKRDILSRLIEMKNSGKSIAAYGAPAKGNTLLNYCGIGTDFIDFTVDKNPNKQNKLLPGSRIPIYRIEEIAAAKPDYVIIMPWNLKDEIAKQCDFIRAWDGKFVVLLPKVVAF